MERFYEYEMPPGDFSEDVLRMMGVLGLCILLMIFALIAAQVLYAVAAYYDSKARGKREPIVWALLIAFFGNLTGIIYLLVRDSDKNKAMLCPYCGAAHPVGFPNCPSCLNYNTYSFPFYNAETERNRTKGKRLFFVGLSLQVVSIATIVGLYVYLVSQIMSTMLAAF